MRARILYVELQGLCESADGFADLLFAVQSIAERVPAPRRIWILLYVDPEHAFSRFEVPGPNEFFDRLHFALRIACLGKSRIEQSPRLRCIGLGVEDTA